MPPKVLRVVVYVAQENEKIREGSEDAQDDCIDGKAARIEDHAGAKRPFRSGTLAFNVKLLWGAKEVVAFTFGGEEGRTGGF